MDDFGTLAKDFGFRPQGKSAPMAAPKSTIGLGSTAYAPVKSTSSFSERDRDRDRGGGDGVLFDDVFGGPPKYTPSAGGGGSARSSAFDYDAAYQGSHSKSSFNDKPVYDDDIFHGLPGMKSPADSSAKYDDVFASLSSRAPRHKDQHSSQFDDLLGDLDRIKAEASAKGSQMEKDLPIFDDLLSGFGGGGLPAMRRPTSESNSSQKPSSSSTKVNSNVMEDPFVVLESISTPISSSTPVSSSGLFTEPLDDFSEFSSSGSTKVNRSPASASVFDNVDPRDSLGNSVPPASSEFNHTVKDGSPLGTGPSRNKAASPVGKEQTTKFHAEIFEKYSQKKVPMDNFQDQFDMSNTSSDFLRTAGRATSPPSYASATANEINTHMGASPSHEENLETSGDIWLTVSEVPLCTQPTRAPPPSRPPPPIPTRVSKSETRSAGYTDTRNKSNDFSSLHNSIRYSYSPKSAHGTTMTPVASQIDDFENFAMGGTQNNVNEHAAGGRKSDSDAAAMKEAMDRAEAKFRHAKELRERDHQKTSRSRESVHLEKDEKAMQDVQEKDLGQKQERLNCGREREEEEREQRRLEKEREQRRLEKAREIEREREKARQAVERATREARERAAAEARLRAERAAVEKAHAEARERAERAAVQRAQAEARERAAAEAKERAEKAAAEARERTRASASRVEAEARSRAERASAERAAAAVRVNQQKNDDDDLESFFSMGSSQPSSTSRPRANPSDPLFNTEAQSKEGPDFTRRTSVGASSNSRKASSSTNVVDDLTSIFGAAPSSGDFHDIEGETEERRRARLERHQRTQERAAKALAEKNERDLQVQREQAERHRIAETLDVEIKRWVAGKEGNLRAQLSTLQYVLWPECGWQAVSLTDLITAAAVKKVYRKATLCIHPDKVQQKGANLQQKYIAEKVFDLLKEAWNKFNSEELF